MSEMTLASPAHSQSTRMWGTWPKTKANSINNDQTHLNTNATTNCSPPKANYPGVHICAPYNGQTVGPGFTFKAAGNAFDGIAKRMELWIDGKKFGQRLEDQFKKTVTLPVGKHGASFVVVDSFDHHAGKSVTFYVQ